MDAEIKRMCELVLRASPEDRVLGARKSLDVFVTGCKAEGIDDDAISNLIIGIVRLFVSADSSCHGAEFSFFKAVTGIEDISEDQFYDMTNCGKDPDFVELMVKGIKSFDIETRSAAILFGVAFLTADLELTDEELELIEKLF